MVVFVGEASVDLGESDADAVLVTFEGVEVYRVGKVRGEEFVEFDLKTSRTWVRTLWEQPHTPRRPLPLPRPTRMTPDVTRLLGCSAK